MATTNQAVMLSADKLGKILMLSSRRVQQLAKEAVLIKAERGKYPMVENIQAYVKYWQDKAASTDTGGIDYHVERARLTKAQAEGQEIKNAVLRRELAPVDALEWVLSKTAGQISAQLDAIPMRVKRRDPKLKVKQIELITREIVNCQNACANLSLDLDEYDDQQQTG